MEDKKEYGYVQFPLCLLRETYNGDTKQGLRLILRYGIMNYAAKLKFDINEVAKQVAYFYYRKDDMLQTSTRKTIQKAINENQFTPDEDYNGFAGRTFQPDNNIDELLLLFNKDSKFKEDCILSYQLHLATSNNHLGISIASIDSLIDYYKTALRIQSDFEGQFGPDAMPFCKKDMLFDFIENPKDIDLFRAYIGIKSMIGRRNFISSNKPAILSRMIGCKSKASFEYYTTDKYNKDENLLPTVEKYCKRYHMDKLLLTLAERKYIMFLSKEKVSVIYLSKYMEPEELSKLIKETKSKQDLKNRIKNASTNI